MSPRERRVMRALVNRALPLARESDAACDNQQRADYERLAQRLAERGAGEGAKKSGAVTEPLSPPARTGTAMQRRATYGRVGVSRCHLSGGCPGRD
jgi:hypothetical protein